MSVYPPTYENMHTSASPRHDIIPVLQTLSALSNVDEESLYRNQSVKFDCERCPRVGMQRQQLRSANKLLQLSKLLARGAHRVVDCPICSWTSD
jgi:hypothetical protein